MSKSIKTSLSLLLLISCFALSQSVWESTKQLIYCSTQTVQKVDLKTVKPTLDSVYYGQFNSLSSVGYFGPLGPYGPLGTLGPIGDKVWNPSFWQPTSSKDTDFSSSKTTTSIDMICGPSSGFSSVLCDRDDWRKSGPMSDQGPLGKFGPLAADIYMGENSVSKDFFSTNTFAQHLRAFGLFTALGPIGPLGALGPLGPLGPVGAHLLTRDRNGNFVNGNGEVQQKIEIMFDQEKGVKRVYPLYEYYQNENYARNIMLDTSFMVRGSTTQSGVDYYKINSDEDQIVTIVLVPEYQYDDYDIAVYNQKGLMVAISCTMEFIEAIQFRTMKGEQYTVAVGLSGHYHILQSYYRLTVTGSTQYLNMRNIEGNHILNFRDTKNSNSIFKSQIPMLMNQQPHHLLEEEI